MAIGAAPRGPGSLAWTIYIWPSQELVAKSWDWPQARHEAFERALTVLAIAAATCILDGRPFGGQHARSPISSDYLSFSAVRRGDSVHITITDFGGPESPDPDWPGPNGGASQPKPVDGLVVGLRGSDRYYRMVVFHGFMAPIPATNVLTPLFKDFGYTALCNHDDVISFAGQRLVFDPTSVADSLFSTIGSLQIHTGKTKLSQTPLHLPDPPLFPDSIGFRGERGAPPEQLNRAVSEQHQCYASPAVRSHALRIHQRKKKIRQGAPPGRYLH
jgi:hypothetical protein